MRASYNWVSLWWSAQWWKHVLAAVVVALGYWRVRRFGPFLLGLPAIGILSVPLSYVLLEKLKWSLLPQVQPARTLLFLTGMAVLLAGICGCLAVKRERWPEAFGWFFVAMLPPLVWSHWSLAALLGGMVVVSAKYRWASAPILAACYFAIPFAGHVTNYPAVHTPELQALSNWALQLTPRDAVFVFPGAGKKPDAGVFRSEALRAIYVDWKGGGQVNYLPVFSVEWWARWQDVMVNPIDLVHYRRLGIDYAVVPATERIEGAEPVFRNTRYAVYSSVPGKAP